MVVKWQIAGLRVSGTCAALLILLCAFTKVAAQVSLPLPDSLKFVYYNWNNKSGLPQNSVFDMAHDRNGYLWGATENGLFRFDGASFKVFDNNSIPGLSLNAFYDLLASDRGIWASGRTSVILISDTVQQVWDLSEMVRGGGIRCMELDSSGRLWIGTSLGRLFYLEQDSIRELKFWQKSAPGSIETMRANGKELLIGTSQGLYRLEDPDQPPAALPFFAGFSITALEHDGNSGVWVGAGNQGLIHAAKDTLVYRVAQGLKENYVNSLHLAIDGKLWIGFRSHGYQILSNNEFLTPEQHLIANDGIRSIFSLNARLIWLGTNSNGLVFARPELIGRPSADSHLANKITLPIYQHSNNDVWVGTAGRGLHRISSGQTEILTQSQGLSANLILSIYGRNDHIYIGTSAGLDRYNIKTGRIDRNFGVKDGLPGKSVLALYKDSRQRLWIGLRHGGLFFLDQQEKFTAVSMPETFQKSTIMSILEDRQKNIWLGSRGGGALKIDEEGRQTLYSSVTGFPADIVYDFFEDTDGDIWFTTEKGLIVQTGSSYKIFDQSNGLFFIESYRILKDPADNIWLSGNLGIQRISLKELLQAKNYAGDSTQLSVRLFNHTDGMGNSETNGGFFPAGWAMSDGTLWFPTVSGVSTIDHRNIREPRSQLNIKIESLQVGGIEYFPNQKIVLPPGVFNFEIRYTSIDFIKAGDIQYFYRLKGFDSQWTAAGNRRIAYFSGLKHGDYIFEVRSKRYGLLSPVETLRFSVEPYFYQTLWFKILVGILVFLGGAMIVWSQKLRAQRKMKEQQLVMRAQIKGQEKERQYISTELHDSISQQLATAKMFLDMAGERDGNYPALIKKSEEVVKNVINDIRALCHSLTPPGLKDIGLTEALEELCRSYDAAGKFNVDFQSSIDPDLLEEDLQFSLYRILQEQMQNIARHSGATKAWIDFSATDDELLISVRDNGKGFDPKTVKYGLGFGNIRNRLLIYNGRLTLNSSPGKGCALSITVPRNF